jgi:hypothetical protein
MSKAESIAELRRALRAMLTLMNAGSTFPKLSRAQGYVDGYMRAMLDSKLATQKELLAVVAEERAAVNGAATGIAASDDEESFAFVRATA